MLTVIKDGSSLSVQLSVNGSATKVDIVVWRRSPEATLLVDRADVVAADVRAQVVKRLPPDVQTEAAEVLAGAALDLALRRAEGGEPEEEKPTDPEPWLEAVDGAALLGELGAFFSRYVVLPAGGADLLAAFVLLTYAVEAFDTVPYLAILSPTPRCGKSRLLELIEMVTWRPWLTTAATGPVIYRRIERLHPTLLLDEAEVVRQRGDAAGIVRALLQAGYRRGVVVSRCVGENFEDRDFDIFGPKVFAAIGRLSGTLLDRCIVLEMQRKRRDEQVTRLRKREVAPQALELRRRARRWAVDNLKALEASRPTMPNALNDRAQEIWEPLLAIGTLAGHGWLERLTQAAERLSGERDDESVGAELVADIHAVFAEQRVERIASATLAKALVDMDSRPWAEGAHGKPLTTNGLARLLKPYGIQPLPLWLDGKTQRCYSTAAFADTFSRYLQPQGRKDPSSDGANTAPEQAEGNGGPAVGMAVEKPRADGTPYGLAVERTGVEANGAGASEARRCPACGEGMNHYGSKPDAGWLCARCYPEPDRIMRGQR